MDDKIIDDFNTNIKRIESVNEWLDRLYYNPEYATFFIKPVLTILVSACQYLSSNLIILRDKYIDREAS